MSDHVGKYRERTSRSRTPYSRPKGLIRRVTDSVTGILGSSWIPGFLKVEEHPNDPSSEADEQNNQQPGPSGYSRVIHQQHSPRSLAPIYPEEAGGCESLKKNSIGGGGNSVTGNRSYTTNCVALNTAPAAATVSSHDLLNDEVGRIFPERQLVENSPKSSVMNSMISAAYQQSSSAGTADTNTTPQHHTIEARHHREIRAVINTPQNCTQSGSMPGDSEVSVSTPSSRLSSAQSSKRPRFSLAAYSAAANPVGDKSILSDGSFRSSPFYPGRTIYGGAAAYRRTPTPVTPNRSATSSPRIGGSNSDGGLSEAAQRILSCLNAMSTPLTDAKRIPTPAASPYASYLDSPYTAAFHKHRPNKPPTGQLHTPAKVGIQSNLSRYMLPRSSSSSSAPTISSDADTFLDPAATSATTPLIAQQPSIFSVAAAARSPPSSSKNGSSNNPLLHPNKPIIMTSNSGRLQNIPDHEKSVPQSMGATDSTPSAAQFRFGGSGSSCQTGWKIKSSKIDPVRQRSSLVDLEDKTDVPALPKAMLPKINFTEPIPFSTPKHLPVCETHQYSPEEPLDGFRFSIPEVVDKDSILSIKDTTQFMFSAPPSVISAEGAKDNFIVPKSSFVPKVKSSVGRSSPITKAITADSRELNSKSGGLLEYLSKSSSAVIASDNKIINNATFNSKNSEVKQLSDWGDKFKAASGSWNCASCLVRNKVDDVKCIACETPKPGQLKGTVASTGLDKSGFTKNSGTGFGDMFKKSAGDWDCDTCLSRNNSNAETCVACQANKPGVTGKLEATSSTPSFNVEKNSVDSFKFGVSTTSSTTAFPVLSSNNHFNFGMKPASTITSTAFAIGTTSSTVSVSNSISDSKTQTAGFGDKFKKASGDWECTSCLLNNNSAAHKCVACDEVKPVCSSKPVSSVSVSEPTPKYSEKTFHGFGDKFKKAVGDWECTVCLVSNKSADVKCLSCESPNPKPNPHNDSKILTGNSSFGSNNKPTESNFKFGITSTNAFALGESKSLLKDSFTFGTTTSTKSESLNFTSNIASKPAFSFGVPTTSSKNGDLKFGTGSPKVVHNPEEQQKVAMSTPATSFTFVSTLNKSPIVKTKPIDTDSNQLPELNTGNISNFFKSSSEALNKENSSVKIDAKPFFNFASNGPSKQVKSSPSTMPVSKFTNTNSTTKPTFAFGVDATDISAKNMFSNSSNNSTPKSSESIVHASNKRSFNEDDGEYNKRTNCLSKNNGISEPFGFGKGSSSSTGAAAPFQFGNSCNASPAKNLPSFGSVAPAFAAPLSGGFSNNNTNTISKPSGPVFAFGQSSENKQSASFDFGQATTPAATYNFASAPPTSFQFGGQVGNSVAPNNNVGIFQFGSSADAGTAAPVFGTGAPNNPFSQTSTPAGRVVKRAIRRTKK